MHPVDGFARRRSEDGVDVMDIFLAGSWIGLRPAHFNSGSM
jgi:hypothetical protein